MAEQSRRSLKKKTLRRQPPPSPPRVSPAIESWLSQVPHLAAKLPPEQLKQWKLEDENRPSRGWFITSIGLRVLSLASAFTIAVIGLHLLPSFYDSEKYRLTPIIVPGVGLTIWNAIEFLVVGLRRGHRGMPRRVHLPADGVICLLVAASIAGFWLAIFDEGYWYIPLSAWWSSYESKTAQYIAAFVFLVILLLIHATFFCFLLCSRRFRNNGHIPSSRIMYLPGTGEAVVVLPRPYPSEPGHQQSRKWSTSPAVELRLLRLSDGGTNLPSPMPLQPTSVAEPRRTLSSATRPCQRSFPGVVAGRSGSSLQTMPPRKPLPGSKSTGTPCATPWPPDHVPDDEELARAERGESQAQGMTLADFAPGLGRQKGNLVVDNRAREGEKTDLFQWTEISTVTK